MILRTQLTPFTVFKILRSPFVFSSYVRTSFHPSFHPSTNEDGERNNRHSFPHLCHSSFFNGWIFIECSRDLPLHRFKSLVRLHPSCYPAFNARAESRVTPYSLEKYSTYFLRGVNRKAFLGLSLSPPYPAFLIWSESF
jgi:hypothetical protein